MDPIVFIKVKSYMRSPEMKQQTSRKVLVNAIAQDAKDRYLSSAFDKKSLNLWDYKLLYLAAVTWILTTFETSKRRSGVTWKYLFI